MVKKREEFSGEEPIAEATQDQDFEQWMIDNGFLNPSDLISDNQFKEFNFAEFADEEINTRLAQLNNIYHEAHSTASNPAKDQRLLPINRVNRFLNELKKRGANEDDLRKGYEYVMNVLEDQAKRGKIAGDWGQFRAD